MLWPSTHGDCLRAIGHVLDQRSAAQVQIEEEDTGLRILYVLNEALAELRYSTEHLEGLVESARSRRGSGWLSAPMSLERTLRTVGQDMDRKHGRSVRIRQFDQSLVVSYLTREGSRLRSTYVPSLLESLSSIGPNHRREPAEVLTLPAVAPPGEGEGIRALRSP